MDISKLLTENSDAVFKINKPGQAQFFELRSHVQSMGLKHQGYFVADFDKNQFESFLKKDVPNENNIVFLFTESYSNEKNVDDVKQAVAMVKEVGMQAVVVLNTHNTKPGVPNAEINYYGSQAELFSGLESMFDVKLSATSDISKKIGNVMDNLGASKPSGSKNKLR
jgi:hypothetical protein